MFYARIRPGKLSRLDAEYYDPVALKAEEAIYAREDWSHLGDLIQEGYRVVYHGRDALSKMDEGVPFLSPSDIEEDEVAPKFFSIRVPSDYLKTYPKGIANDGELLIEVKGNTKKVAIFLGQYFREEILISGSFYKALLKESVDDFYVLSFLKSSYGNALKRRLASNINISYISKWELYSIPVPLVKHKAQKYIGDKVRQAERLRFLSSEMKVKVNKVIDAFMPNCDRVRQKYNFISFSQLHQRIDARPYQKHQVSLREALEPVSKSVIKLASVSGGDAVSSEAFQNSGLPLIRIRDIKSDGFFESEANVSESYARNHEAYLAKAGRIVVGLDGEFRAQFFLTEELPAYINQRIAIIDSSEIRPELLCEWLNRYEGQEQLNQWAVQTTVEHISTAVVKQVLVPAFPDDIEQVLANELLTSRQASWYSKQLLKAAKYFVEALIEPETNLTEKDLIKAYENPEADRALMERLKVDGFDGEGDPLFPDLGTLADLITKATNPDPAEA